jgi:hypothetical protein
MRASVDLIVPPCSAGIPNYDFVPYSVSGWAGIDGDSACSSVVLQAGKCLLYLEVGSFLMCIRILLQLYQRKQRDHFQLRVMDRMVSSASQELQGL